MDRQEIVLDASGISVRFGGIKALEDVSVSVRQGEILGLVGPNGAGKSTLLNAIGGVFRLAAGTITFEGQDITKVPLHRRPALGIGRTFQGVELFRDLTVLQNLMAGRHPLMKSGPLASGFFFGSAREEEIAHRRRVEEIIEFFELEQHRNKSVGALSYGAQKIVGLARAMCVEPRLLLLDEVASGLNREEKEDLARFMLRLKHTRPITMIWVEHDMRMVGELVDSISVLASGRLVCSGKPEAVLRDPAVQEAFLGPASAKELQAVSGSARATGDRSIS